LQTPVWLVNVKQRDHIGDPHVTESIIVNGSERNTGRAVDWMKLIRIGEEWWAVVNAVLNLLVP